MILRLKNFCKITWKNKSIWINGSKNGSKMEGLLLDDMNAIKNWSQN